MKAKEFLQQARFLDQRINSKVREIEKMNALATNMSAVISDMPKAKSSSTSRMEDTVCKIIDYENEVREDLDRLISIKKEINDTLEQIDEVDYRIVLQKRYLEMCSWEEIACDIDKKVRWVQMLHGRGLDKVQELLDRSA